MRKTVLLAVVALLTLPVAAGAQIQTCSDCLLGLWDDPLLNKNFGDVAAGTPKDIYVGIQLGAGETGVSGLEFSVYGVRQAEDGILVVAVEGVTAVAPNVILGSAPAPADTSSTSTGTGGLNVAWPSCVDGSGPLLKITILSFSTLSNKVFKVLHKYPPSNPLFTSSIFTRCDAPNFTAMNTPGGCYIANWDGVTDPVELCQPHVAVEQSTWSGMKQLFR